MVYAGLTRQEGYAVPLAMEQCARFCGRGVFEELVINGIVSLSPDGNLCKLTDYGIALFQEMDARQQQWSEAPIIKLEDANKDEITIGEGQVFRAKFFVMSNLFKRARHRLWIQDAYLSHEVLAWLYSTEAAISVRLLTSERTVTQDKAFAPMFAAYRAERPESETRLSKGLHDRRIILDCNEVFGVGESLKDMGRTGTVIVRLADVAHHVQEFERLWDAAMPL